MVSVGAGTGAEKPEKPAEERKTPYQDPKVAYISVENTPADVLRFDAEGKELIFEFEKDRFLVLDDETIRKMSHVNRVRYSVSVQLNAKDDPEGAEIARRFKFVGDRNRRAEIVSEFKDISGSQSASRALTVHPGHGFRERWARPDKLEYWRSRGYEVVAAGSDGNPTDETAFVNAPAQGGHFATRTRSGVDELILMRAPLDVYERNRADKQALADRPLNVAKKGFQQLAADGGQPFRDDRGSGWVDRTVGDA